MDIKKLNVKDLQVGMIIHSLESGWLLYPYRIRDFTISCQMDIQKLIEHGIEEVYVYKDGHPAREREGRDKSKMIGPEDTFETDILTLKVGSQIPFDVYFGKEGNYFFQLLEKGDVYGIEAFELVKSSGSKVVLVPKNQADKFESYKSSFK